MPDASRSWFVRRAAQGADAEIPPNKPSSRRSSRDGSGFASLHGENGDRATKLAARLSPSDKRDGLARAAVSFAACAASSEQGDGHGV